MCELIIKVFKGLLTLPSVTVFIALYIAWQQLRTNKQALKLKIYDKRFYVYKEFQKIFKVISANAKPSMDDMQQFRKSVSEADFLFGPEIRKHIDEICNRGRTLEARHQKLQPISVGEERKKMVKENEKDFEWFEEQPNVANKNFKKYLGISNL